MSVLAKDCSHPPEKFEQAKYEPTRWFCGVCYVCVSFLNPVQRVVDRHDPRCECSLCMLRSGRGSPRAMMRARENEK